MQLTKFYNIATKVSNRKVLLLWMIYLIVYQLLHMMTSSNGNIFRVTGHLSGEFTGPRWIPRTKASDAGLLMFSLICAWINGWVNNGAAGELRHHRAHYYVIVMIFRKHKKYLHFPSFLGTEIVQLMMTSLNESISALLALCVGTPPVTEEFPSQRHVTRSSGNLMSFLSAP